VPVSAVAKPRHDSGVRTRCAIDISRREIFPARGLSDVFIEDRLRLADQPLLDLYLLPVSALLFNTQRAYVDCPKQFTRSAGRLHDLAHGILKSFQVCNRRSTTDGAERGPSPQTPRSPARRAPPSLDRIRDFHHERQNQFIFLRWAAAADPACARLHSSIRRF